MVDAANMAFESALSSLERLRVDRDARQASELLASLAARRTGSSRAARLTKTFMFTDIVDSTRLVEMLSDDCAGKGVPTAARVGAAGGAGEILASRDALAAAGDRFSSAGERLLELGG